MGRIYLRGKKGRFAGSIVRFLKIPTPSNRKFSSKVKDEIDYEQYAQAEKAYEKWVNSFLLKKHPDNYPELTYHYGRSLNGNPMIRLLKPTPSKEILSRPRMEEVDVDPKQVGGISWNRTSGEIESIGIEKGYQRQGLATELYNLAVALSDSPVDLPRPKHSLVRSPDGDAWALSVGDQDTPENETERK